MFGAKGCSAIKENSFLSLFGTPNFHVDFDDTTVLQGHISKYHCVFYLNLNNMLNFVVWHRSLLMFKFFYFQGSKFYTYHLQKTVVIPTAVDELQKFDQSIVIAPLFEAEQYFTIHFHHSLVNILHWRLLHYNGEAPNSISSRDNCHLGMLSRKSVRL